MFDLFHLFLFLHIGAAIVAFGPTYVFAIGGAMGRAEPQHANFMVRVNHAIADKIVLPFALSMAVTGVLMILNANIPLKLWLILGIAIYVAALLMALLYLRPNLMKVIALSSGPPGPDGPPPELMATVKKVQVGGMINGLMIAVIVALMVFKPGI